MRHHRLLFLVIAALVLMPALPVFAAPQPPSLTGWRLTDVKIVNAGSTVKIQEGTLTSGIVIEATAWARSRTEVIQSGRYQLTLSVFAPATDMPGQPAGYWYLQGAWTISDYKADKSTLAVRHNPYTVKGSLSANLAFDPVSVRGQSALSLTTLLRTAAWQTDKQVVAALRNGQKPTPSVARVYMNINERTNSLGQQPAAQIDAKGDTTERAR